jgi:hypothetical protein
MENIYIVKVEKFHFNCIQHLLILILITLKTTSSFIPFSLELRIKVKLSFQKTPKLSQIRLLSQCRLMIYT